MMTPELVTRINTGEGLTDEELQLAINFYEGLSLNLTVLGPRFDLAVMEINRVLVKLKSIQHHRG